MKKLMGLLFLFIIFNSFIVVAGDVLKLDFTEESQYVVGLKKGDRAEFYLNGERNIIIVDKIKPDSVDLTTFVAQETNGYPFYSTLVKGKVLRLDVERDDIDDIYISFMESDKNLEYSYLLFKIPETTGPTGNVIIDDLKREKRKYDIYLIIGFVLIVILLVFLIVSKKPKNSL